MSNCFELEEFKFLLKNGQTGLSTAFDMPTLMGYDADHAISDGEVGHCGVNISSLKDMEADDEQFGFDFKGWLLTNFEMSVRFWKQVAIELPHTKTMRHRYVICIECLDDKMIVADYYFHWAFNRKSLISISIGFF